MKLIPAMLHLLFGYFSAKAQQTTNVSGGTLTIENFTLDWSFGELTLIGEASNGGLLITKGILQPDKGVYVQISMKQKSD
ncbi:MAG: hypothetical protein IPH34_06365 [Chitinophagaceae bacterium]|nr:hypothetical protein [Chitinophagaceae bacterium]MBK8311091.1 hypothetical protein [Chitinophagaceae bacterium]MBP6477604.1 hypothetical protein [Chitinophagaceae bacterium]MBP7107118.1 hypothetical protein [Chitinophagaceae bacterium]MBP7314883.1 hypothetical protein [Chitinophagaceae bacterium]